MASVWPGNAVLFFPELGKLGLASGGKYPGNWGRSQLG